MHNEPYEIVSASFRSLVQANYPKEKLIVVLATEERVPEARITAKRIREEFGSLFFQLLITVQPSGLPDEIPGKGSNEAWAVKEAKKASAPSRSGRWKLAAALGALGVSLAAGGVLYFSEARQNEELTQLLERLDIGTQKCIKANDSLVQEGKGLMNKVKFYKKQSCAEYTE